MFVNYIGAAVDLAEGSSEASRFQARIGDSCKMIVICNVNVGKARWSGQALPWMNGNSSQRNEGRHRALAYPHLFRQIRIAAGGTLALVLKELVSRGASLEWIKVVAVVIAPPAADLLSKSFPSKPLSNVLL